MAENLKTILSRPLERGRKLAFLSRSRLSISAVLSVALGAGALPVHAQSPAILLGNPQITPGLLGQGYVITTSVNQTATATNITYNVTPPPGGSPNLQLLIGTINLEGVLPSGTPIIMANVTVTFTGVLEVNSFTGKGTPFFQLGYQSAQPSPQSVTGPMEAGVGSLAFSLYHATTAPSTMTVSINVGNSTGARKPYLNDFDGSGATDYSIWRRPTGNWWVNLNTGSEQNPVVSWGASGDVPVPGDYDADGFTDYAIWRPSTGNWWIRLSSSGAPVVTPWGSAGDIPVPYDYDGDGKTDLAIFRPSDGNWWIKLSSTGAAVVTPWGQTGDIPVPGDYDGDGKADLAIFRPSDGNWWIKLSSTGAVIVVPWGESGDVPVPGDYDLDGKTDVAIWRPADGTWWIKSSSTGQATIAQWGQAGDIPVPGDYDRDGKNDYAVWEPSNGTWYINASTSGIQPPIKWGAPGDIPIGQPFGFHSGNSTQ